MAQILVVKFGSRFAGNVYHNKIDLPFTRAVLSIAQLSFGIVAYAVIPVQARP